MRIMRRLVVASCLVLAFPALVQAATNPVVAAAKRTAAAKTLTFGVKITTAVPGQGGVTMTGSGAQRGTSVKLSMRTRANGLSFRMDAVLLQEKGRYVMYMRSPVFRSRLPRGKSWVSIDLSKRASSLGLDFTSLVNASQTFAPLEKGLVSTTRVGRAVVAGRSATQYRAVIDIQRAARAVPAYGRQVAALERAAGIRLGRVPYDVWVASDGHIRRMRFTMPTVGAGRSAQTMTFLSFDSPVTISAPPPAQVVPA